jgi:hypothetical protein
LLLVIGGVVAEVAYEGLSSNADTNLRSHESDVLSAAEIQAADAYKAAREANERAEKERRARAELEESMQWRRLSLKQREAICRALPISIAAQTLVFTKTADSEALQFADDFTIALADCSPSDDRVSRHRMRGYAEWPAPVRFGVWIGSEKYPRIATTLASALKRSGVEVSGISSKTSGGDVLEIYVGPLPPPVSESTP